MSENQTTQVTVTAVGRNRVALEENAIAQAKLFFGHDAKLQVTPGYFASISQSPDPEKKGKYVAAIAVQECPAPEEKAE